MASSSGQVGSILVVSHRALAQLRSLQEQGVLLVDVSYPAAPCRDRITRYRKALLTVVPLPRLSPDFSHGGGITVPGEDSAYESVASAWHSLKEFEREGPQVSKKTVRLPGPSRGAYIGHRIDGKLVTSEEAGLRLIVEPAYSHVLSNAAVDELRFITGLLAEGSSVALIVRDGPEAVACGELLARTAMEAAACTDYCVS